MMQRVLLYKVIVFILIYIESHPDSIHSETTRTFSSVSAPCHPNVCGDLWGALNKVSYVTYFVRSNLDKTAFVKKQKL